MIEQIIHDSEILAIIVRNEFDSPGIHFVTPGSFSQQLAFMSHTEGTVIPPHVHNEVRRDVSVTQEVLIIREGKIRVDLFTKDKVYLESRVLGPGDIILLASGGHGFQVLEPLKMIEVKQGPYAGDADKSRFELPAHFLPKITE